MKYRRLGASDLEVSEISLGSWLTYGVGVEAESARACLDRAFELGINFIDTANIYGRGAAETFLGEALQGRPRDILCPRHQALLPDDRHRPRPVRARRSRSSSTPRWSGSRPTMSISISATAMTTRRRSRRRWRR